MREEAEARGSRELARAWGVGHETFRKFHAGITAHPQPRQLQLYREKFQELHPSGYVREKQVDGKAHALPQLKMVLPPGRENAQRVVEQIQDLVARHADELEAEAPEALQWMRKVLNAEYEAEGRLPPRKPRRPKPADK